MRRSLTMSKKKDTFRFHDIPAAYGSRDIVKSEKTCSHLLYQAKLKIEELSISLSPFKLLLKGDSEIDENRIF